MATTTATRRAWESFQAGSRTQADRSARAEILGSWERSHAGGVLADRIDLGRHAIDTSSVLVTVGAPILSGMADLLVGTRTSLALADWQGTLSWRWESETALSRDLDRIEFEPGSRVEEPTAGTNAIGVATRTGVASLVVGAEHYKQPWHGWACVAAPVVHPISRQALGVVNVACRAEDANQMMLVAVGSLARAVETAIADAATGHQRRLVEAHQRFRAAVEGPVVALDRHTMIIEGEAAGLDLDRSTLWSIITEAGPRATDVALGKGLRASVHHVGTSWLDDGVVLLIRRCRPETQQPPSPRRERRMHLSPLEQSELTVISQVLEACGGRKTEAAARLGISRGTLYQRLRRYGIV